MIDENRKDECPGVTSARSFLLRLRFLLSGIITTNYDMLVEYALGTRFFNYGQYGEVLQGRGPYPVSQFRGPVTLRGQIALAKMHGSISWDIEGRYTDGRPGITGNALIVAPTAEKTAPSSLTSEWKLASRILKQCNSLLVFGFAFNPYDEVLLDHLKQQGDKITHIVIVDKRHKPDRVAKIWPQAHVELLTPPPERGPERASWFVRLDGGFAGRSKSAVPPASHEGW
jgi:hypothetical protein